MTYHEKITQKDIYQYFKFICYLIAQKLFNYTGKEKKEEVWVGGRKYS